MISENAKLLPVNVQNLLAYFSYTHLPSHLQKISKPFSDTANLVVDNYVEQMKAAQADDLNMAELVTGLHKLLEAKDCMVRAHIKPS